MVENPLVEIPKFEKTPRQKQATTLLSDPVVTRPLLYGGSRSGKTFLLVHTILTRALKYPGSRHLILRLHFTHAKTGLCYDTIPKCQKLCYPQLNGGLLHLNKQDWFYTLPNGSEIWIGGLDEGDRVDKILGKEYCSIYFNEASELTFAAVDVALTRLAQKIPGCINKAYFDCNPPNKRHWTYAQWIERLNPKDRSQLFLPERYALMQMNPHDNAENLADGYVDETLEGLKGKERKRFLDGEFTDDAEGALWKSEWIRDNRIWPAMQNGHVCKPRLSDYSEIVVAVDPAVSAGPKSDDTGIIVVGRKGEEVHVLADFTMTAASPLEWAMQTNHAYTEWDCNWVVGEVNQGGDLVKMNILHANPNIPFFPVRATRGKAIRAEPVAQLSQSGRLKFIGEFPQLEEELVSWSPLTGQASPNRLDALVWGVVKVMRWGKRAGVW